jgi:hypothetical protein
MEKISRRGAEYAGKKHPSLLGHCFPLRLCAFAGNSFFSLPQSRKAAKKNQPISFLCELCVSARNLPSPEAQ